ncbi:MAG TPA: antitoxin Xre/MbcA/ParS toxin-binding domain-containing protein [Terriglobales bacterium]|nr:antitoxin Xre/MbcA/ParS toxin-binding domain-containing protein [Terriglobales bacterium]
MYYTTSMYGEAVLGATSVHIPGVAIDRPLDLSSKAVQEKLSPAANRAFFSLTSHWKLRDEDSRNLLGGVSNGSFYQLKRSASKTLDQDKLTRISLLIGIFKALNILYSPKLADAWVQLPNTNPIFAGESPLTYMRKGGVPSMIRVRQLLDSRRGGL